MQASSKPKLLICIDWFVPAYKGGGPIRSCANFAYAMRSHYDIYVLSSDRDFGDQQPLAGIVANQWQPFDDGIQVCYLAPSAQNYSGIAAQIQAVSPDFVYLNSMYSLPFAIYPMLMKRLGGLKAAVILAPRGMLHSGALQYKSAKKKIFLTALRLLRVPQVIRYHATDTQEAADIRTQLRSSNPISTIANFPNAKQLAWKSVEKQAGTIRFVFLSRIAQKKNLHFFLTLLKHTQAQVQLDVYGGFEESAYQQQCEALVSELPSHVQVVFHGDIPHERLPQAMEQAHVFVLPTFGENFGHAIFEALQAGKPVLVSDQTPWRTLATQQIGWDIPLNDISVWENTIETAANWDQATFDQWSQAAWHFAKNYLDSLAIKNDYLTLFS